MQHAAIKFAILKVVNFLLRVYNLNRMLDYTVEQLNKYKEDLKLIASLSNLYSDSDAPLIYYRATENIYCDCFGAVNVSRTDCTADALLRRAGIGIKTFLSSTKNQKIAEFNRQRPLYSGLNGLELAKKISELRNERISFAMRVYCLNQMIYHCVVRSPNKIEIFEEPLVPIDIESIELLSETDKKITFKDNSETYEFYFAKSTLFKQFKLDNPMLSVNVRILDNPMERLRNLLLYIQRNDSNMQTHYSRTMNTENLIIPLYSCKKGIRFVGEKSGLNQWNAGGRKRDENEIYIPYPASIRKECQTFFPNREEKWEMKLPDGSVLSMKVCQQGGKALMSDPNKALGKWLLRDVLGLRPGEVLTYEKLLQIGIDSVIIKKRYGLYSIDFIEFEE